MTCEACEKATAAPEGIYYYRIGNKKLRWGNIAMVGCRDHIKLAMDRLNSKDWEEDEKQ